MSVVVDASAALGWLLPTQATAAGDAFLESNIEARVAPAVFPWEVGNVLARRVQKGLISPTRWPLILAQWESYDIVLAEPEDATPLLPLALAERLSLFDASYLALAVELDAELATRDTDLIAAARRCGVAVHDLRDT